MGDTGGVPSAPAARDRAVQLPVPRVADEQPAEAEPRRARRPGAYVYWYMLEEALDALDRVGFDITWAAVHGMLFVACRRP
jgi:hypothetical protein